MTHYLLTEAIAATKRCSHDFSCLTSQRCGTVDLCTLEVEGFVGVISSQQCQTESDCPYHVRFGNRQACTCPTRNILYLLNKNQPAPDSQRPDGLGLAQKRFLQTPAYPAK
jgi:hypothetical protein